MEGDFLPTFLFKGVAKYDNKHYQIHGGDSITMQAHDERVNDIFNRMKNLKEKEGVTYATMGNKAGITRGMLLKLTSPKARRMTEENLDKVEAYLKSKGV